MWVIIIYTTTCLFRFFAYWVESWFYRGLLRFTRIITNSLYTILLPQILKPFLFRSSNLILGYFLQQLLHLSTGWYVALVFLPNGRPLAIPIRAIILFRWGCVIFYYNQNHILHLKICFMILMDVNYLCWIESFGFLSGVQPFTVKYFKFFIFYFHVLLLFDFDV